MTPGATRLPVAIRLYGGADDGGIFTVSMRYGQEPIALGLSTGTYLATGLEDPEGRLIFALAGSEQSLWLNRNDSGQTEN